MFIIYLSHKYYFQLLAMSQLPVSEIIEESLYLGDDWSIVHNSKHIIDLKIDLVINVAAEVDYENKIRDKYLNVEFRRFPMRDSLEFNIRYVCDEVADYINTLLICKQKVYVHCALGISRSPAIIIYYLMKYREMSYQVAYDYVKKARPSIDPNQRFCHDLKNMKI
jgi:protein-tyrosine phosphatase